MTHRIDDKPFVEKNRTDKPCADRARTELHWAIVSTLCRVLHGTPLPANEVLAIAASAIGSIYREVAEAHSSIAGCPCGWTPNPARDIAALLAALESATCGESEVDLRIVPAAGRA